MNNVLKKASNCLIMAAMLLFLSSLPGFSAEETIDIKTIIDRVDKLYRSKTSQGEIVMQVMSPHYKRSLSMKIWSEGLEKTFILITSPRKDKGIATLRIGNNMWNYFPKINKVMKVPPSMMMGSWMGSDFTNDDLVKESSLLHDYNSRLINPENTPPEQYVVELTPRIDTPTVWGKIIIKIRKKDYIPIEETYYDEKDNAIRRLIFSKVKDFGGRSIPSVLEMIPLTNNDRKTVIIYKDIIFDREFDSRIFSLRNLQKKR